MIAFVHALQPLVSRVRTDVSFKKSAKYMTWTKEPLTDTLLLQHVSGGAARGVCPIKAGEDTTRVGLFDLDAHKGTTPWDDMAEVAETLGNELSRCGMTPIFFRSSGGHGIHIFMLWDEPQDAHSVRQFMAEVLHAIGYKNGTRGVAEKQIEIFPKQDNVPPDGFGNQFILPLTGKSVSLDPNLHLIPAEREYVLTMDWPISTPVPFVKKKIVERPPQARESIGDLSPLAEMLGYIDPDCGYEDWVKVGMAVHFETDGSDEGLNLWDEWSSASLKMQVPCVGASYIDRDDVEKHWNSFKSDKTKKVTVGTIKHLAYQGGWPGIALSDDDFDDLGPVENEPQGVENTPPIVKAIIKDPKDWGSIAKRIIKDRFTINNELALRHAQQNWYQYDGRVYENIESVAVEDTMRIYLEKALKLVPKKGSRSKEMVAVPFHPNRNSVAEIEKAVQTHTRVLKGIVPMWVTLGKNASEYIALQDGLLHLPTKMLEPHTANFLNTNMLPFDWEGSEGEPREWLKFLNDLWGNDPESIDTLRMIFGYLLSGDTSQQKMFMIKGPRRSGKGTIIKVLENLLGLKNVTSTTFAQLATTQFGLDSLIGKAVAFIPEARNIGGKNVSIQIAVERMLSISGEDRITINRKYQSAWHGKLPTRFFMVGNELPALGDSSDAFSGRFIVLTTTTSYFGNEDTGLEARLLAELPQIMRWGLDGHEMLRRSGRFKTPKSSEDTMAELEEANNPVRAFLKAMCEIGSEYDVDKDELYNAYKSWCSEEGRFSESQRNFMKTLKSINSQFIPGDTERGGERLYPVKGLRVKSFDFAAIKEEDASDLA